MAYETQPGTIPHRAVEYLKTLDAGVELSTAALAEALMADPTTVAVTLRTAAHHGVLRRRESMTAGGRKTLYWALGNGTPEPTDPDTLADAPVRRIVPAVAPITVLAPKILAAEPPVEQPFEAWLSSRGTLRLQGAPLTADGVVMLTPEQTAAIRRLVAWSGAIA